MIVGIVRPILERCPPIGGIPEQKWQDESEGDQAPKQRPAREQQAALWGKPQSDDQREPPEEDGLLRQQSQASHQAEREPASGMFIAQQDDEDGGAKLPPEFIEDIIGVD